MRLFMYPKTSDWRVVAIFKIEPKEQLIMVSSSYMEARQGYIPAFVELIDLTHFANLDHIELQQWNPSNKKDQGTWKGKGTLKTPPLSKILQVTSPILS